jgi:sugar lactone lactonase YvrE
MKFSLRSAALLLCGLLAACGGGGSSSGSGGGSNSNNPPPATIPVTSVSFSEVSRTAVNLTVGGATTTLTAIIAPDNATNKNVTWESSAPGVASVNATGTITAVSPGTAQITVNTVDGGKSAAITVNVATAAPLVTAFTPTQARHDETVTLTGTGFSAVPGDNSVTFNGIPVTVSDATTTQLKITVPKNLAASGKVQVTVAGKTGTATESFTYVPTYVVTTLAGNSTAGLKDDTGIAAQFNHPYGVAVQSVPALGLTNLFVADTFNDRIRAITQGGVVVTLAGGASGTSRSEGGGITALDGTGTEAKFSTPIGLGVSTSIFLNGIVYIADSANHSIRRMNLSGTVTTVAGSGAAGFRDDTGITAQFNNPRGVAVDEVGNVFVADNSNHRIRKITPAGVVTTLAGSGAAGFAEGTGTAARFNQPNSVAVDSAGNVYVADYGNHRIRRISAEGVVTTLAGGTEGFADGTGAAAQFDYPYAVAVDAAGNVYVSDYGNNRIRRITVEGVVSTLAGSDEIGFADDTGAAAQFNQPAGITVDSAGNLYVADVNNNRIRMLKPE